MRVETREERRERRKKEKAEETAYQLEQAIALWNPNENPQATADPFKTLFIARINYETSEGKLRREFEQYGAIKQVRSIVRSLRLLPLHILSFCRRALWRVELPYTARFS